MVKQGENITQYPDEYVTTVDSETNEQKRWSNFTKTAVFTVLGLLIGAGVGISQEGGQIATEVAKSIAHLVPEYDVASIAAGIRVMMPFLGVAGGMFTSTLAWDGMTRVNVIDHDKEARDIKETYNQSKTNDARNAGSR